MAETCDKCGITITDIDGELQNAKCLKYKDGDTEYFVARCNGCFETKKALTDYKKCEVYSRVCGYIRPMQNWNKGKKQEQKDKKIFKEPKL
jgi:anaerobic ribonucleoside-triphosphate reductase